MNRSPLGEEANLANSGKLFGVQSPLLESYTTDYVCRLSKYITPAACRGALLPSLGDDEFFGSSTSSSRAMRNPLTLDELVPFSKRYSISHLLCTGAIISRSCTGGSQSSSILSSMTWRPRARSVLQLVP